MFNFLNKSFKYKMTVTKQVGEVSITYTAEANTTDDLVKVVNFFENYTADTKVNLCDTCKLCIATCPKNGKKFGDNKGNDNVYKCEHYEKV